MRSRHTLIKKNTENPFSGVVRENLMGEGPKGEWDWCGQKEEGEGTEGTLREETSRAKEESSFLGAEGYAAVLLGWD